MARPKKYTEEQLINIIDKYIDDTKYITKIKYSDLVAYAKKIGYKDIIYQDFFRNSEVKRIIEDVNNQKGRSRVKIIDNGEIKHYKLNVDELLDKNWNDKTQLKKLLKIFKEGYDKAFNELKVLRENLMAKDERIRELESICDTLTSKNVNLKIENKKLKNDNSIIKENKKNQCLLEGLKFILDTRNVEVSNEGEVSQLLTSFGVPFNKDTKNLAQDLEETLMQLEVEDDVVAEEDVHKSTTIDTSDNVIDLTSKKKNVKRTVRKPDYLME